MNRDFKRSVAQAESIVILPVINRTHSMHFVLYLPCPPRTQTDVEMARLPIRLRALVASILWKTSYKRN